MTTEIPNKCGLVVERLPQREWTQVRFLSFVFDTQCRLSIFSPVGGANEFNSRQVLKAVKRIKWIKEEHWWD